MIARRAMAVAVSLIAVGTLAACENTAAGTPTPESDVSLPAETTESDRLAPPVEEPKKLTGLDPCELLTASQLTAISITDPGVKDKSLMGEDQCTWKNSDVIVGLSPDTQRDGIEDVYRSRENFDNFEESDVDGYPAARTNYSEVSCSVWVGVADGQAFVIQFGTLTNAADNGDLCGDAESVASTVLKNLPDA